MINKLREVEARYNQMLEDIANPEIVSDQNKFRDLMREQKKLTPLVEEYRNYQKLSQEMADAKEMMTSETDADLKAMAEEEYYSIKEQLEKSEEQLKILLLPHDPDDDKNIIIEIRSGAGGQEAALFAHSLHRMYTMYAEIHKWKTEVININETELGGVKEVVFSIDGEGVYSRLKFESGVHRVQRVPETESQGRIQTSTVTVAVLPEAEDIELEIKDSDIKMETMKSSGAGGQHINKTESAVRLIHIPTGTVVECQEERSQYKNKDKAMMLLRSKILSDMREKQNAEITSARRSMVGTGDRSERIRTYNFPQGRVTDHRIGYSEFSINTFMDGVIDNMIDALVTADTAARLSANEE